MGGRDGGRVFWEVVGHWKGYVEYPETRERRVPSTPMEKLDGWSRSGPSRVIYKYST